MADSDSKWIGSILSKHSRDNSIVDVLSAEFETATKPGENYMSTIIRAKLKVILGSGKVCKKALILKKVLADIPKENRVEFMGNFALESLIYEKFLSPMESLIDDRNVSYSKFWPEYIYGSNELIVLEDLKASGYLMASDKNGLDLEHAEMVYKQLARFHSLSVEAVKEGAVYPKILPTYMMAVSGGAGQTFFRIALNNLSDVIKESWGPEWSSVEKQVRSLADDIVPKIQDIMWKPHKLSVINHGDFKHNNMMFSYDSDKRPLRVKLIDFQICFYNSYAWDFTYFMFTSIHPRNFEAYMDPLIKIYCEEFANNLERLGSDRKTAPTVEDVKQELIRFQPYCFAIACSILVLAINKTDIHISLDDMVNNDCVKFKNLFESDQMSEAVKTIVKYFKKNNLFS